MSAPRLVLASTSPRRMAVLEQLGLRVEIVAPDVDEVYLLGESPTEHVERLARAKAHSVSVREPGALVIGGDTVVVDGVRVLGKPADPAEAVRMLMSLSGRTHAVLSGVAVSGPHGTVSTVVRAGVRIRPLDDATACAYVATGEPLDKAGAYAIQGRGAVLVEGIDGDYYSVVGLPVGALVALLETAGWRYDFGTLVPVTEAES